MFRGKRHEQDATKGGLVVDQQPTEEPHPTQSPAPSAPSMSIPREEPGIDKSQRRSADDCASNDRDRSQEHDILESGATASNRALDNGSRAVSDHTYDTDEPAETGIDGKKVWQDISVSSSRGSGNSAVKSRTTTPLHLRSGSAIPALTFVEQEDRVHYHTFLTNENVNVLNWTWNRTDYAVSETTLWDEAYNRLLTKEPNTIERYEKILSLRLSRNHGNLPHFGESMEEFDNLISHGGNDDRRSQMKKIIETWPERPKSVGSSEKGYLPPETHENLNREEDSDSNSPRNPHSPQDPDAPRDPDSPQSPDSPRDFDRGLGGDSFFENKSEEYYIFPEERDLHRLPATLEGELRRKAQNQPAAALAWAAICIACDEILCLVPRSSVDRSSLVYIAMRLDWYSLLPRALLADTPRDEDYNGLQDKSLEPFILNLYEATLLRLISIVCRYAGFSDFARRTCLLPNVPEDTHSLSVEEAENALASFSSDRLNQMMNNLSQEADNSRTIGLHPVARRAIPDDPAWNGLYEIDSIPGTIDLDVYESSEMRRWLVEHPEYATFRHWVEGENKLLIMTSARGSRNPTLMSTVIQDLDSLLPVGDLSVKRPSLLHFFCSNGSHSLASALATVIERLLVQQPWLGFHVRALQNSTGRKDFGRPNDFLALSGLFCDMIKDPYFAGAYVILDAVDDCDFDIGRPQLVDLMGLVVSTLSLNTRIRWLLSSNEPIKILHLVEADHLDCINLDASTQSMQSVFTQHIKRRVSKIASQQQYETGLDVSVMDALEKKAGGNYLWSWIACQALQHGESWHATKILQEIPSDLPSLYTYMYKSPDRLPYDDPQYCKDILEVLAITFQPLGLKELAGLARLPTCVNPTAMVEKCFAFLEIRNGLVCFSHMSAREHVRMLLLEETTRAELHSSMAQKLLNRLIEVLGPSDAQCSNVEVNPSVSSLVHWMNHLCKIDDIAERQDVLELVKTFFRDFLLEWVESLTRAECFGSAASHCRELLTHLKDRLSRTTGLLLVIEDVYHFLSVRASTDTPAFEPVLNTLIYCSENSIAKQKYLHKLKTWIATLPTMEVDWTREQFALRGHSDWVRDVAFSSDGRLLASASNDRTVRIWDTFDGSILKTLDSHLDWVNTVAISSKGLLASGSDDGQIIIWSIITGEKLRTLEQDRKGFKVVRFSPDGFTLVAGSFECLIAWDTTTFKPTNLDWRSDHVRSIAFSSDSRLLASGGDCSPITIWNLETHKVICEIPSSASSLAFSPDAKQVFLRGGEEDEQSIKIWDITTCEMVKEFGGTNRVASIALSTDGKRLAASNFDKSVSLWDLSSMTPHIMSHPQGRSTSFHVIAFSPLEPILASSCRDIIIRLFYSEPEFSPTQSQGVRESKTGVVSAMAVSPDEKHIAIAWCDQIALWDAKTGQELANPSFPREHVEEVLHLSFSSHQSGPYRLASSSKDESAKIWDVEEGKRLYSLGAHTDWVRQARFSSDGQLVATACDDGRVRVWDIGTASSSTPEPSKVFTVHKDFVRCVSFSPDGSYLASGGDDCTIFVWDCKTWQQTHKLEGHEAFVHELTFTPDSRQILSSDYYCLKMYDLESQNVRELSTTRAYHGMQFKPRSTKYVMTNKGAETIMELDPTTPSDSVLSQESEFPPYSIAYEGEDEVGDDRCWIMWKGRKVIFIPQEYHPTASCVFGTTVVIGCETGKVLFFDFRPDVIPPGIID